MGFTIICYSIRKSGLQIDLNIVNSFIIAKTIIVIDVVNAVITIANVVVIIAFIVIIIITVFLLDWIKLDFLCCFMVITNSTG